MTALASASPPRTARRSDVYRAAWAVTSVFAMSNSPTPLYVRWQHQMGFSSGTLTVVFAAYIVGLIVALLIAGQAADAYGRKRVVAPGMVLALAAAVLFLFASNLGMLLLARLLTGLAVGVIVSAGMAAVVDLGSHEQRHHTSMIASVAMVAGAGLGPLLAGAIYQVDPDPVRWVFLINIVLLGSAVLAYLSLPLPRPATRSPGRLLPRLPRVPRQNRSHVASGVGVFAPGLTATSFVLSLGPSLLVLVLGNSSPLLAGGAACMMFLAATGSQLALARLDVHRLFALGTASTVLAMACVTLTVHTKAPVPFLAAAVLAGAGQGLGQLGGLRLVAHHVAGDRRAEANAALNIGVYLPAAVITVAVGFAVTGLGMPTAATTFAIVLGIIALVAGIPAYKSARGD
jgi:MFS family permease